MKSLKKNCRNTPQIAEEAHDIAGFPQKHGYRRCLRRIEGPKPDWICPNGTEQVTAAVVSALRQVRKEGYEPEDTRILLMPGYELPLLGAEPHPEDPSALAIGGQLVASAGGGPRLGMPEVLSVEDFKGLEAAACIVVGGHRTLDQCEYPDFLKRDDYLRSNLYIAFTRAKHRLFVVLEGITHKALAQKLPADYAHLASIRSEQDVGANGPYTDLHHIVAHHAKRGRRRR